jgi:hypothetical protein
MTLTAPKGREAITSNGLGLQSSLRSTFTQREGRSSGPLAPHAVLARIRR